MSVGYRIWVGAMGRDVTAETLTANFSRFGTLSEGIRLKTNLTHRFGSEAVTTFVNEQDAARALSVQYVGEYYVYISWYEQRQSWSLFKEEY